MNIQQFRHFISNLKVAGGGFGAEKADESFAAIAPLCRVRQSQHLYFTSPIHDFTTFINHRMSIDLVLLYLCRTLALH